MRKLTVLSLFIFSNFTFSQNWQPLNRGNHYNYFTSPAFTSASVVQTDSVSLIGSDSVFFLNRVVTTVNSTIKLVRQGQFLGKQVVQRANGLITFMGNRDFTINVLASPGNSWTFDSLNNYLATTVLAKYDTIFGLSDSMKVIGVSNHDTILISKNYGILSFKDASAGVTYSLKGIQNLGLGYHVPMYPDFYDFNPGDVFEYKKLMSHQTHTVYDSYNNSAYYRYTILSKTINGNHTQYIIKRTETDTLNMYTFPMNVVHYTRQDTLNYYDTAGNFLNGYNNERIAMPYKDASNYAYTLDKAMYFGYSTTFQASLKFHVEQYFTPLNSDTVSVNFAYINGGAYTNSEYYGQGTGLIESHWMSSSYNDADNVDIWLMGCKKGNTVYGTLSSDSLAPPTQVHFSYLVFPTLLDNTSWLTIQGMKTTCTVLIYATDGRLVLSSPLFTAGEQSTQLDLTELDHGMYFVELTDSSGPLYKTKIVKIH